MAKRINSTDVSSSAQETPVLTTAQRKEQIEKYDLLQERFAATREALHLLDLAKTETRSYSVFSREKFRQFMKNPKSNEKNLRNLVRFVYRYSMPFQRIVHYYAEMIDLNSVSVIPLIDPSKKIASKKVMTSYIKTLKKLQEMGLAGEIYKMVLVCWLEGASFGYIYDDYNESDGSGSFFIHVLGGEYCRISSIENGICRFAFDFSYFQKHKELLDMWAPEFKQKYTAYENDTTNMRWQELDSDKQICLKIDMDDPTLVLSPWLAIMENLISIIDLQGIQNVKDNLSVYKLIVAKMETFESGEADDWKVNIDSYIDYFNKLSDALPPEVSAVISPMPLDTIEFKGNTTEDEDIISNAMKILFQNSGGSAVLGTEKYGSSIYDARIMSDSEFGISSLLPQLQSFINTYLDYTIGEDHAFVKYLEVTPYTRKDKKKQLLESGANGVPVKMAVAALDGFTPLETISLDYLENTLLKLQDTWIPFQTSYTQSNDDASANHTKDADDMTDEGLDTRDQEKNQA